MKLANEKAESSSTSKKYPDNDIEQRSSLPDIPLSNREKAELENSMLMQNSHSSESVLHGLVPPPKPSKDKKPNAPPLPPKKKTYSIDEPDASSMQLSPRLDMRYPSRNNSNNFDVDGDFEFNERGKSFSSIEKSLIGATSVNAIELSKAMISSQMHDFNDSSFSSKDLQVCKIKISQESNSRVFQSTSSDLREMNNSFNFMAINQSDSLTDQTIRSNESFCMLNSTEEQPPPLPIKTRSRSLRMEHHKSVYDNVEEMNRSSLDTKASTTSSNSSLTSTISARTENANDISHLKVNSKLLILMIIFVNSLIF